MSSKDDLVITRLERLELAAAIRFHLASIDRQIAKAQEEAVKEAHMSVKKRWTQLLLKVDPV